MFSKQRGLLSIIGGIIILLIIVLLVVIFSGSDSDNNDTDTESNNEEFSLVDTTTPPSFAFADGTLREDMVDETIVCSGESLNDQKTVFVNDAAGISVISKDDIEKYPEDSAISFTRILEDGSLLEEDHTNVRLGMIEVSCLQFTSQPYQELSIDYPGTDEARAYLVGEGVGGLPNANVVIYASKDGDLINGSITLRQGQDAINFAKEFSTTECAQTLDNEDCIVEYIVTDENIALANTKVREFVEDFEIAE